MHPGLCRCASVTGQLLPPSARGQPSGKARGRMRKLRNAQDAQLARARALPVAHEPVDMPKIMLPRWPAKRSVSVARNVLLVQAMTTSVRVHVDAQVRRSAAPPSSSPRVPPTRAIRMSQLPASVRSSLTMEALAASLRFPKPPKNPTNLGVLGALVPESGVVLAQVKRPAEARLLSDGLGLGSDVASEPMDRWSEQALALLCSIASWARQGK